MSEPAAQRRPRSSLIARGEQGLLLLLALAVVAGVAYRAARYYRLGAEPLEVVPPSDGPTYRVNVNTADWVTLALVPGLGEALSKHIVETRQVRPGGRFDSLDDLKAVPGISDKLLTKLEPYLVLAPSDAGAEPVQMVEPSPPSDPPAPAPTPSSP